MPKFYRTTITYQVLSEDPFEVHSLAQVVADCDEGHCVGRIANVENVELTPKEAADHLSEFSSEPGFFQLNADGTPNDEALENPNE